LSKIAPSAAGLFWPVPPDWPESPPPHGFPGLHLRRCPRVYLDPGHGGTDPGAVGNGLQEKDLTLNIALQVRDILLANYVVDVRMSRTTDVTRSR